MRKESALLSALLLILLTPKVLPAAPRYHLVNLGTLEGYPQPEPTSINNHGQVVGLCFDLSSPAVVRATLFDKTGNGNNVDLGTLGGDESVAASINDHNQIVGTAENSEDPPDWCLTAFDINGSGNNTPLLRSASGRCINNKGIIAGHVYTTVDQSQLERAALFDIDHPNAFTAIGILAGLDCSQAYSINSYGDVVGIAYNSGPMNFFETRAVRFDPCDANNNIDLGTLPGCDWATPFCINDHGHIVGRAHPLSLYPWDYFTPRAVLFDPTGAQDNIGLGSIPDFDSAEAFSINNNGQIVGRALNSETMYDCAVMFDPTGQGNNINLNDRIEPGNDLYIKAATAINDHGWITGVASDTNGHAVAFLLVPLPAAEADFEPDGDVDLEDFAVLAAAWRSRPGDENWNALCDIYDPSDDIINERDLSIFASNYLTNIH